MLNILKKQIVFIVTLALKPFRLILFFLFHTFFLKLYKIYFPLAIYLKKQKNASNPLIKIIGAQSDHLVIIFVTLILLSSIFVNRDHIENYNDLAGKTILATIISNEFDSTNDEQIIEEGSTETAISLKNKNYLDNSGFLDANNITKIQDNTDNSEPTNDLVFESPTDYALKKPQITNTKNIKTTGGKIGGKRNSIIEYEVVSGDSIGSIANKFNISINTILWENDLTAYSVIHPGKILSILPTSGVIHSVTSGQTLARIAALYGVDEEKIREANNLKNSDNLLIGQKLIVPGGRQATAVAQRTTNYSGISIIQDVIQEIIKPKKAAPVIGSRMVWPTVGYRITQYYSWRHLAIDIANHIGTPIYAADAGVIAFRGWSTGYGNNIIVDHGSGRRTRYAHLSQFYTKLGEEVDKGEAIGAMGSTGWSTGPHLHFEVIINGVKYNPLNYVR